MSCEPFDCDECGGHHDRCKGHRISCPECDWSGGNIYVGQPCIKCQTPCVINPCRKWPNKVLEVCDSHGAGNKRSEVAAQRKKLDIEVHKLLGQVGAIEPVGDPYTFLAQIAGEMNWVRGVLADKVGELEALEDVGTDRVATQIHVLMAAYEKFLSNCARIATDMSRLDLDNKIAKLNSAVSAEHAATITRALEAGLATVESLTPEERQAITTAFGNALREVPDED